MLEETDFSADFDHRC